MSTTASNSETPAIRLGRLVKFTVEAHISATRIEAEMNTEIAAIKDKHEPGLSAMKTDTRDGINAIKELLDEHLKEIFGTRSFLTRYGTLKARVHQEKTGKPDEVAVLEWARRNGKVRKLFTSVVVHTLDREKLNAYMEDSPEDREALMDCHATVLPHTSVSLTPNPGPEREQHISPAPLKVGDFQETL